MPRRAPLTEEEVDYLRRNAHRPCSELATRIGCCTDTLKRHLVRHGIREFPGAKYARRPDPVFWKRPCMSCGCTKPRPKGQYRCTSCHEATAAISEMGA